MALSRYFWVFCQHLGLLQVCLGCCLADGGLALPTHLPLCPPPDRDPGQEETLNHLHPSKKKVVSLKIEALALRTDVKKPSEEGQSWLGLGSAGIKHREIAEEEMEAEKWDLSAGFPWSCQPEPGEGHRGPQGMLSTGRQPQHSAE